MCKFFSHRTADKVKKRWLSHIAIGALLVLITGCLSEGTDRTPWELVANCSINDSSVSATTGVSNPYYNGYRLLSESYSYVSAGTGTPRETRYIYSYGEQSVGRSLTGRPSNSGWVSRNTQNFDENGFLTGGSRITTGGIAFGFGHSYSFNYTENGQIQSYDIDQTREATFVRNQGRLDAINFYKDDGEIRDTITYQYDEQSHLVSAFDSAIDLEYLYRCNDQNQITDVYTNRTYSDGDIRRDSQHKIEYDEHGNLIKITTPDTDTGVTRTYEYQQTNELVFNHWLMRLSAGFVWKAADLVD